MNTPLVAAALATLCATPLLAEGDVTTGEKAFRKCVACHVVVNDAGETLAGKKASTGPNLYGVAGRAASTVEGFKYSAPALQLGEAGVVWDEANFTAFVQDPTAYLRATLDDGAARSKMTFRVRKEQEAADLYAYLASLSD
ncbi:c-type cytochrome [Fluviibacterium sp. DFM31]|uniref:C-type cytochrome n=1 Tax=Meridianimarinicoccus marinus TaxID=3231483 RepID=A0ABV3L3D1_9RHOB